MKKNLIIGFSLLFGVLVGAAAVWFGGGIRRGGYERGPECRLESIQDKQNIVPVAIIGSGPAGLTAALYCARSGLHTVVFEGDHPGGQLMETSWVENWPGMTKKMGPDLIKGSRQQALEFGALFASETVKKIDVSRWPYHMEMASGLAIEALSIVIATGATPKRLGVHGESEYWGKGVTTCATCDAPFYGDAAVVVVGGGDAAVEQVLQLVTYARQVTVLVRGDSMRASPQMRERLKAYEKVKISYKSQIVEIAGDGKHVNKIVVATDGKKMDIPVTGVFLAIGHLPNAEVFKDVVTFDEHGCIAVYARSQKTAVRGIFAAGDVADPTYRQAGVAAGDGIKAGLDAAAFLRDLGYDEQLEEKLATKLYTPEGGLGRKALAAIKSLKELDGLVKKHDFVVLDFYTDSCPSCMQLLPILELWAAKKSDIAFNKVNVLEGPDIANRYEITSVPSIVVLKKGSVIARMSTGATPSQVMAFLQKALEG